MIAWRDKFRAVAIHFVLTLLLAAMAATLIFVVWFPRPFGEMIGGTELFQLVVGCDIVLGPLMSLVIYNRTKSRRALVFDYTLVGALQVGAIVYGLWITEGTRPVYFAFVGDRYEIVTSRDLKPAELAAARDPQYARVPFWGIRDIAIRVPPAEADDALFQALSGNEEPLRPKFYVPFDSEIAAIRDRAKPLAELERRHPEAKARLEAARAAAGIPDSRLRWLPVRYDQVFWTALIDTQTGRPVRYVDLDPY
jgi:hypothetical protein